MPPDRIAKVLEVLKGNDVVRCEFIHYTLHYIRRHSTYTHHTSPPCLRRTQFRAHSGRLCIRRSVHDVKAVVLGVGTVRFKAELKFDGVVLASRFKQSQHGSPAVQYVPRRSESCCAFVSVFVTDNYRWIDIVLSNPLAHSGICEQRPACRKLQRAPFCSNTRTLLCQDGSCVVLTLFVYLSEYLRRDGLLTFLGQEIDRIEEDIRKAVPEVQYVDLEIV